MNKINLILLILLAFSFSCRTKQNSDDKIKSSKDKNQYTDYETAMLHFKDQKYDSAKIYFKRVPQSDTNYTDARDKIETIDTYNSKVLQQKYDTDYSDWTKYDIKGFGEIKIPPDMEIQTGKYKELSDKFREINGFKEPQIVFQQKGMNDFKDDAKSSYARVMLKTIIKKKGDFGTLHNFPVSYQELRDADESFEEQMKAGLKKQNITITEWYPLNYSVVNGMSSILVSYKRQLGNNPEAIVQLYQLHNNDRMHSITLSYRITEKDKWEPLLKKVLKSIIINEIK